MSHQHLLLGTFPATQASKFRLPQQKELTVVPSVHRTHLRNRACLPWREAARNNEELPGLLGTGYTTNNPCDHEQVTSPLSLLQFILKERALLDELSSAFLLQPLLS